MSSPIPGSGRRYSGVTRGGCTTFSPQEVGLLETQDLAVFKVSTHPRLWCGGGGYQGIGNHQLHAPGSGAFCGFWRSNFQRKSVFFPINNSTCSNIHHSEFLVFGSGPFEFLVIGARQATDWIPGAWYLKNANSWRLVLGHLNSQWLVLCRGYDNNIT